MLDDTIFLDNRESAPNNEFTVLKADGDLKEGSYTILYRVYLANYQEVEVI